MEKITAFDKVICRTPAFGINQTLDEVWEDLKAKIAESSPSFYELIKDLAAGALAELDEKTKFTIWKYFNRSRYRSTPFGSFAAVSLVGLGQQPVLPLCLSKEMVRHYFVDWSHKTTVGTGLASGTNELWTNGTFYFVDKEIRYIKANEGVFELAAIGAMPELNAILLSCRRKTKVVAICELMKHSFNLNEASTLALLNQLCELQLLFTEKHPNIIGTDYFARLGIQPAQAPTDYIISERLVSSGSLDARLLKGLPEMVSFFASQLEASGNHNLNTFKQSFRKRFDQQEVALSVVMDPEIGIGYGNLAQLNSLDSLVSEIRDKQDTETTTTIAYGSLQQFVLQKLVIGKAFDLAELANDTKLQHPLPNSFSILYHLYQNQVVIASAGGVSANALLGRFTLTGEQIEAYGHEIAQVELAANPDVLFFDIAYQAEKKVDNVNRRKQLYPYELPLLSWSENKAPLDLNDIVVAIEQGTVVLKSKALGKRLIPRIPSAYNYGRSDLAVYRFLCDVQNQRLSTNFNFKPQDLFPKLASYPRVNFKSIIVAAAMWLAPRPCFKDLGSLQTWLKANDLPPMLKAGIADQALYFNVHQTADLWALLRYGKQQNEDFYLSEALLDEVDSIKDEEGNKYQPQYIVNYYHSQQIYAGSNPLRSVITEKHIPGSAWLYLEIYCHPVSANRLLRKLYRHFIQKHRHQLKKWFFIRYTDPSAHIRLRLQLKKPNEGFALVQALGVLLEGDLQSGIVSNLELKTYQPELLRYGAERMELVERFFNRDSEGVLQLIHQQSDEQQLKVITTHYILALIALFFEQLSDQLVFAKRMAASFADEMNLAAADFKKINSGCNELKELLIPTEVTNPKPIKLQAARLLQQLIASCASQEEKMKLLADLIHMHINRLFIADQRIYEMLIYHYGLRVLLVKKSRLQV